MVPPKTDDPDHRFTKRTNCPHFSFLSYAKHLFLIPIFPSFSPNLKAKQIYPFSSLRLTSLPIPLNIYPPDSLTLLPHLSFLFLVPSTFPSFTGTLIFALIQTQLQPVLKNQHITLLLPPFSAYFLKVVCIINSLPIASTPTITCTLKSSSGLLKPCFLMTFPTSPCPLTPVFTQCWLPRSSSGLLLYSYLPLSTTE